jgi:outer membrane lipoprotein-sorting protein
VPVGTATVLVAGAALAPVGAVADSPLPERTAQELLVALQEAEPTALSGTVAIETDLGLPALPMGVMPNNGPMGLVDGPSTVRVWTDGGNRARLALIDQSAETTVISTGSEVWVWSSAEATAQRLVLPETDELSLPALPDKDLPDGIELPSTPAQAAELALEAIEPTTEVSTSGAANVAGRDTYELILSPRDATTLIDRIVIATDAETNVVLRVQVYATSGSEPAIEVGFTSVDFGMPDEDLFEFTPPEGATVSEREVPTLTSDQLAELTDEAQGRQANQGKGTKPTVVGEGWSAVVVAELPTDALADLAESGQPGSAGGPPWAGTDPTTMALALLEALPETSGAWGSGRALAGTLFSAIVTDDGRIAIGAVPPETLGAALASTR